MTESGHKTFDAYADDYDVALAHGISVSGENKDYFAQRRIEWLRDCLNRFPAPITALMDFGCGTGSSSRLFFDILGVENFVGMDQSPKSLEVARKAYGSERAQFLLFDEYQPCGQFDLVFCNGVFHHIPPAGARRSDRLCFTFAATRWIVCVLGEQSLESRHSLCDEPNSLRSRCHHPFLTPKRDICCRLAGSRFSEQIFCLSFREFFIGAGGSNHFAHDFPWARNIKFFAVNLHSGRYVQQ